MLEEVLIFGMIVSRSRFNCRPVKLNVIDFSSVLFFAILFVLDSNYGIFHASALHLIEIWAWAILKLLLGPWRSQSDLCLCFWTLIKKYLVYLDHDWLSFLGLNFLLRFWMNGTCIFKFHQSIDCCRVKFRISSEWNFSRVLGLTNKV